ncbi:class F sortase [Arthrobacter sp. EPSL27]|uniref:class F sortase n=1 Tax=Arthrobacter sp. EPSL27 TaxID=1745378 RepID=UPI00074800C8|nr:class F sortase [Arthrobacter sp. EPSL27]KUM41245.1 hypothetical protein AR539_01000 [Arthrobacter sp. EPSL27]
MKITTAPAGRNPVCSSAGPRTSSRSSASSSAARFAAALATALLVAGCTAPQNTAPQNTASQDSAPQVTSSPEVAAPQDTAAPQRPAQAGASSIPVRPATPLAPTPRDPAPRNLTVEGTTINMPVVEVGVSPDGQMEIPEPFEEAGWYRFGPAPGAAAGTAVIAAHVDTTSDSAPFSQLKSLTPGTLVTVQREGAGPATFRVTGVELMAKDAFDGASLFRRDGPPQLKLVTCGGRWLDEQQDYGDNVIVTAVPA